MKQVYERIIATVWLVAGLLCSMWLFLAFFGFIENPSSVKVKNYLLVLMPLTALAWCTFAAINKNLEKP